MSRTVQAAVAVIGIDIGKNSLHRVAQDNRGAIVLRQRVDQQTAEEDLDSRRAPKQQLTVAPGSDSRWLISD